MELRSFVPILFLLLCVPRNRVSTFTVALTKSPDKALFGTNQFQLTCTYNVGASEQANSFRWQRKRATEETYTNIATFFPPSSIFNGSISDPALNSRVSLTDPTSGNTNSVLTFSEIECNDEAEYRCEGTCTTSIGPSTAGDSESVQVSKKADFSAGRTIPFTPGSYLTERDNVAFTCEDDIGKDPQGTLHWYYFIDGQTVGTDVTNVANTQQSTYTPSTCSYKQISTLVLTMEKRYNRFVVRCTLEQFNTGQTGDGYRQTYPIPVNFEATTRPTTIQPTTIQPTMTTTAESKTKKQTETCMECPLTVTAIVSTLCGIVVGVLSVLGTIYIKKRYTGGKTESNVVPNSRKPPSMTDIAMTVHKNVRPDGTHGRMDEACYQDLKRDRAASASEYQTHHLTGGKTESNVIPNSKEPPSMTDIAMAVYTNVAPDGTNGKMDEACYQDLKQDRAASVLEYQTLNLTDTASK